MQKNGRKILRAQINGIKTKHTVEKNEIDKKSIVS